MVNSLLNDILSYWKLDEASGDADDAVENYDGTVTGATYGATGVLNDCYSFDGSGDYVSFGDVSEIDGATALSISLWMKTSSSAAQGILGKDEYISAPADHTFLVYKTSSSQSAAFFVSATAGSWDASIGGDTEINDGEWHHIVCVYDGANPMKLYIDGVDEGTPSGTEPAALRSNAQPLILGRWGIGTQYVGDVDEVGVWETGLTSTQVGQLYNSGNGLAYSSFDSGAGAEINPKIKAAGTFSTKPIKYKTGGAFASKVTKVKVSGSF